MSITAWSGRLSSLGATANEISAITASYYADPAGVQAALDTLIAGISNQDLAVMLNTWRTSAAPFHAGYPGGGLPFGTGVPVLSGNPADDQYGIGAGTGVKLAAGGITQYGSGAPSNSLGNNGNTYIDPTAMLLYGPKASGAWPAPISIGANVELGYAENRSLSQAFVAGGTFITGLAITVIVGARPIVVRALTPFIAGNTTGDQVGFAIFEGSTRLNVAQGQLYTSGDGFPGYVEQRLAPTPGSHTYQVQAANIGGTGGGTVYGTSTAPAWIQAVQV